MSDKEKILVICQDMYDRFDYDVTGSGFTWRDPRDGKGVCEDYARAFREVCVQAGIPCFDAGNADHGWNLVYADGEWYAVDTSAQALFDTAPSMEHIFLSLSEGWTTDYSESMMELVEATYKMVY